jgi:hypothetical protein
MRRFLGWLHRYKGVPLQDLSLEAIIRFVPLQDKDIVKQAAKQMMKLCSEYLRWLRKERDCQPGTEILHVEAFVSVA